MTGSYPFDNTGEDVLLVLLDSPIKSANDGEGRRMTGCGVAEDTEENVLLVLLDSPIKSANDGV